MSGSPSSAAGNPDAEDGLHSVPLLCRAVSPGPALDATLTWLAGPAGDDATGMRRRCEAGTVFTLVDVAAEADDPPAAAAVIVPHGEGAVELFVVLAPGAREPEMTRRLLAEVGDALRYGDAVRLVVAAANRHVPPADLLREAGFGAPAVAADGWLELRL